MLGVVGVLHGANWFTEPFKWLLNHFLGVAAFMVGQWGQGGKSWPLLTQQLFAESAIVPLKRLGRGGWRMSSSRWQPSGAGAKRSFEPPKT